MGIQDKTGFSLGLGECISLCPYKQEWCLLSHPKLFSFWWPSHVLLGKLLLILQDPDQTPSLNLSCHSPMSLFRHWAQMIAPPKSSHDLLWFVCLCGVTCIYVFTCMWGYICMCVCACGGPKVILKYSMIILSWCPMRHGLLNKPSAHQ